MRERAAEDLASFEDRVIQRSNGRGPAPTRLPGRLSKPRRNRNGHLRECWHRDDDKANNNVWNLCWASRSANIEDCVCNGSHNMARRAHREDCRCRYARRRAPFKEAA